MEKIILKSPIKSNNDDKMMIHYSRKNIKIDESKNTEICLICLGDGKSKIKLICNHYFCDPCLKEYLAFKLNYYQFEAIMCPMKNCCKKFTFSDIVKILPNKRGLLLRYVDKFEENLIINSNKHYKCPFPDCPGYSVEYNNSILNCSLIMHYSCLKCLKPVDYPNITHNCLFKNEVNSNKIFICGICQNITEIENSDSGVLKCINCYSYNCLMCDKFVNKGHFINYPSLCYKLNKVKKKSLLFKHRKLRILRIYLVIPLLEIIKFILSLFFGGPAAIFYYNLSFGTPEIKWFKNCYFFIQIMMSLLCSISFYPLIQVLYIMSIFLYGIYKIFYFIFLTDLTSHNIDSEMTRLYVKNQKSPITSLNTIKKKFIDIINDSN